ncbi:MAG: adenine phosphoribosyltransferase [Patescibacteria group bacterium]|nr:adenine phosphoribosyltransferase [Patescibacteria group bacterium]
MNKNNKIITRRGKPYYKVEICGTVCNLPLFEVAPNTKIALFNILGETTLITKIAKALAKKLPKKIDAIVTPEVKSMCLAYELARIMKIPYVVVRKHKKPYMLNSLQEEVISITTGKPQNLWLDGKDRNLIKNKKVVLIDDVISTGNTLTGLRGLVKKSGGKIIAEAAVFTEGDKEKWKDIIALGHLPIFKAE